MKIPVFPTLLGTAIVALSMVGCGSAKFERDWNEAIATYHKSGGAKDPVVGPWEGSWLSHHNAHEGDLRCLVTSNEKAKPDESDDTCQFRYHATWGKSLKGTFVADFPVQPDGKRGLLVKGEKSLGLFGGFQNEGWIKGDSFKSTFGSEKGDYGVFELARPE